MARRCPPRSAARRLGPLGAALGACGYAFAVVRPSYAVSLALFAGLAMIGGARTSTASAVGLDLWSSFPLHAMTVRAGVLQFGYLLGAGLGGVALTAGGFESFAVVVAGFAGRGRTGGGARGQPARRACAVSGGRR